MIFIDYIGIVGALASIAGLIYAYYYKKMSLREKKLVYEVSDSLPVAVAPRGFNFHLYYSKEDDKVKKIDYSFLTFIRFANFGKEPIRSEDLLKSNPVRIIVVGAEILTVEIANVRRKVNNIILEPASGNDSKSSFNLIWDFLDYKDGARVALLTEGKPKTIDLVGDIIGMPEGIINLKLKKPSKSKSVILYGTSISTFLSLSVLDLYLFKYVTGSWSNSWFLVTPIIVLLLSLIIIFAIGYLLLPNNNKMWAPELRFLPLFATRLIKAFLPDTSIKSDDKFDI